MDIVAEAWLTLVEEAKAETVGGQPFFSLITLESGSCYGLAAGAVWARRHGDTLTLFSAETVKAFVEVFEHPRREFEDHIDQRAGEFGLPVPETAWSFPALDLVRAIVVNETPHFVRLALMWVLPTELRDLRADISRVAAREDIPQALRDLALHLCVPED